MSFVGTLEQFHASVVRVCCSELCISFCLLSLWSRNNIFCSFLHICSIHFQLLRLRASFKFLKCTILPLVPCFLTPSMIHVGLQTPQTDLHVSQTIALEALVWGARGKVVQGRPIISYLLSASISSTNWQKIISLFASYVPFQQARLSHYGGGKSCSIEVETLLVFPPFLGSELGMNSPPQSQTTILFFSLLFRQRLVYSVRSTFLSVVFFSAWVYCMDGFLLCSLLKMYCAWWKVANTAPNAAPFFVWMSTCNVYVTHCVWCDPVSRMVSARPMAHHVTHPERQSRSVWNWN